MSVVQDIYEVFTGFFGSSNVDLQEYQHDSEPEYKIIVFWDEVTVTNETGKSINIWNLYARITLNSNGSLVYNKPSFIRSCYDDAQWDSGYMHSHCHPIYSKDLFFTWDSNPCLGRGPLNITMDNLRHRSEFYTDMDYWMLFCVELDKYVHVESLKGIPYIKLSCVGASRLNNIYSLDIFNILSQNFADDNIVTGFIKYLLHNPKIFKFSYYDGTYNIGMPFVDLVKAITNEFLNWYYADDEHVKGELGTQILIRKEILKECYIKYDHLVYNSQANSALSSHEGRSLGFIFKGNLVTMTMKDSATIANNNKSLILNLEIVGPIIHKLLTLLNFGYGNSLSEEISTNGAVRRFV